jgi:hypothetical protein
MTLYFCRNMPSPDAGSLQHVLDDLVHEGIELLAGDVTYIAHSLGTKRLTPASMQESIKAV